MDLPSFPNVDLFAAGVNALYGVLVARNPSHDRGYTVAGLLIMAYFGGIGGGVTRDVLLNLVPGPFLNPIYLVVCLLMGLLGLAIHQYAAKRGERFRTTTLAFVKSFTLPWFAVLGAHKALEQDLGIFAAIVVGVIATTAGGVVIDLFSAVTPEIVEPAEHLVTTAVLASGVYAVIAVLARLWEAAGYPWSVRLKALVSLWRPWIQKRFHLSAGVQRQLEAISARQIDRRLRARKQQVKRRCYGRTKPGAFPSTALRDGERSRTVLKHQIPVKTDAWDVRVPIRRWLHRPAPVAIAPDLPTG